MRTIDSIQNDRIIELQSPEPPISTNQITGKLKLDLNESDLIINNGRLSLNVPINCIIEDMVNIGTPLNIDFTTGTITFGKDEFPFPSSSRYTADAPLKIEDGKISLDLLPSSLRTDEDGKLMVRFPIRTQGNTGVVNSEPLIFDFSNGSIRKNNIEFPLPGATNAPIKLVTKPLYLTDQNSLELLINMQDFVPQTENLELQVPVETSLGIRMKRTPLYFDFTTGKITYDGNEFPSSSGGTGKLDIKKIPLNFTTKGIAEQFSTINLYQIGNLYWLNMISRFCAHNNVNQNAEIYSSAQLFPDINFIGLKTILYEYDATNQYTLESQTLMQMSYTTSRFRVYAPKTLLQMHKYMFELNGFIASI